MPSETNLRVVAAKVIEKVLNGHSLTDSLTVHTSTLDNRNKSFIQALCFGVCRFYPYLAHVLQSLLAKPLKQKDSDIYALLLVGLYQLKEMKVPDYASVSETVNATQEIGKVWAKGLINAVLREYLRKQALLNTSLQQYPAAFYAHPMWLLEKIKKDWPNHWETILQENNKLPPLALRVNRKHLTREDYAKYIAKTDLSIHFIEETNDGIILYPPIPVTELPGFLTGDVSIQDGAAQIAAELLMLNKGDRVLDACTAPGGKLTHILEIMPDLAALIGVEKEAKRLTSINENLKRLNTFANLHCADAKEVEKWWDGEQFDKILLDAPCSGSGVIRRHPDIKLLRRPEDVRKLADEQRLLLEALWPLLKIGGLLLYSTCSIFPEENVNIIESFLSFHKDALEYPITANWGLPCSFGRQTLPGIQEMDGFYYARIRKVKI